jgi:hypothetical protein
MWHVIGEIFGKKTTAFLRIFSVGQIWYSNPSSLDFLWRKLLKPDVCPPLRSFTMSLDPISIMSSLCTLFRDPNRETLRWWLYEWNNPHEVFHLEHSDGLLGLASFLKSAAIITLTCLHMLPYLFSHHVKPHLIPSSTRSLEPSYLSLDHPGGHSI